MLRTMSIAHVLSWFCVLAVGIVGEGRGIRAQPRQGEEDIVRRLLHEGRYVEAEAEAERWVAEEGGIAALNLLLESMVRNGHGALPRAMTLAQRSDRLSRSQPNPLIVADSQRHLGDVKAASGDYKGASDHYRGALQLGAANGASRCDMVVLNARLAETLLMQDRYDEGMGHADDAATEGEQPLDPPCDAVVDALMIRSRLWQLKNDRTRALADVTRAVQIREMRGERHPDTARALSALGAQQRRDGNPIQALQTHKRALGLAEVVLRPDHPDIAEGLRAMAMPMADLGDTGGAKTARERGLAIAQRALGPGHPHVADHLNDLALILVVRGDLNEARALYERALRIYVERMGPEYFDATTAVFNMADVAAALGDLAEARRQYLYAIRAWSKLLGADHMVVAYAQDAFAGTLLAQGALNEARTWYERALAIRKLRLGDGNPLTAQTGLGLARTLTALAVMPRASELAATSVATLTRAGQPLDVANGLMVQAEIAAALRNLPEARRLQEAALALRMQSLGQAHPDVAEAEASLAHTVARLGDRNQALVRALRAESIGRSHLLVTLTSLVERQALQYATKRPSGLSLAVAIATEGEEVASTFDALVRMRSLVLDEIARRRRAIAGAEDEALTPLVVNVTSARQRLASLSVRGPGTLAAEQYLSLLYKTRRERDEAERALAERSQLFRSELDGRGFGAPQIRMHLPPDTALVSFVSYARPADIDRTAVSVANDPPPRSSGVGPAGTVPSYAAFVVRSGDTQPQLIHLVDADVIDPLVARWRRELMVGLTAPGRQVQETEGKLRTLGVTLRQRVWDPIAAHVGDARRVFIVPDGALHLVSFAALPAESGRYLIDDGPTIHYLSAERDLAAHEASSPQRGEGWLAFGAPAFSDTPLGAATLEARLKPTAPMASGDIAVGPTLASAVNGSSTQAFRGTRSACGSFQSVRFGALAASRQEVREIEALWRQHAVASDIAMGPAEALVAREASEETFKAFGPGQRVIHLATHGFFLGADCSSALDGTRSVGGLAPAGGSRARPRTRQINRATPPESPLVLSGLAFAGANLRASASPEGDDGILTAEEVASMDLDGVEWAVLSACDTGLGEIRAGEGVFGLRRAFQIAGVRTVIMSLWSVEDEATRQWMRALYEGRLQRHLDTADAVREAALSVLRERRAKGLSTHPFYWAAFVAAGDWR